MKYYYYLFYRVYKFMLRVNPRDEIPEISAMVGISMFTYVNILTIMFFCDLLWGGPVFNLPDLPSFYKALVGSPVMVFHYLLLIYRKKYFRILNHIEKLTTEEKKNLQLKIRIYIVTSIISPIVLIYILHF